MPILSSARGRQRLCFCDGLNPQFTTGEKHEENGSQDRIDNAAAFGFRRIFRSGRQRTSAHVLPTALSCAIGPRHEFRLKFTFSKPKIHHKEKKHEDHFEDYLGNGNSRLLCIGASGRRHCAGTDVLPQTLPRAISFVHCGWLV